MSQKTTLLNEAQIRKFMKLAAIGPLVETFIAETEEEEIEESASTEEDSELTSEMADVYREEDEEEAMPADLDADLEEPALEEPALEEPELDAPAADGEVSLSDEEVQSLVDLLRAAEGVVSKLEAALAPAEEEAGMEMDLEEPALEPELDVPAADGEEDELEEPMMQEIDDDLLETVLKKVASRLATKNTTEATE